MITMWSNNLTNFVDIFTSVSPNMIISSDIGECDYYSNDTADSYGANDSSSLSSYVEFCKNLQDIGSTYNKVHGIASITICVFGTLANILNFIILTRKEMVNSTNAILTGFAVSDLLNLVEYVPFAIYTDYLPDAADGGTRKTYPWALYVLIHSNFSQVCHTISIWLTVTIAAWRYFMISMPLRSRALCSMQRAKLMVTLAYCITPILCLPIYFTFSVQTVRVNQTSTVTATESPFTDSFSAYNNNNTMNSITTPSPPLSPTEERLKYIVNLSNLSNQYPHLVKINFWIYRCATYILMFPNAILALFLFPHFVIITQYSVVLKIIPCILLTVVSFCLINSLLKVKKRKEMLLGPLSSTTRSSSKSNIPPGCFPLTTLPSIPSTNIETFSSPVNFTSDEPCTISRDENPSRSSTSTTRLSARNKIPFQEHPAPSVKQALPTAATSRNLTIRNSFTVEVTSDMGSEINSVYGKTLRNPDGNYRTSSFSASRGDIYLTSRTTRMLLTVLILFLITEFPQGILDLFSAIIGQEFFRRCYIPMANLMDFLALFNCSINFLLYCFMSKRFRDAMVRMVRRKR